MVRAMARTSMSRSVEELEALVAQQQEVLDRQRTMLEERDALIAFYREWKRLIDSQRLGAKSERFAGDEQGRLFNAGFFAPARSKRLLAWLLYRS